MRNFALIGVLLAAVLGIAWTQNSNETWLRGVLKTGTSKVSLTNATGNLSTTSGAFSGAVAVTGALGVSGAAAFRNYVSHTFGAATAGATQTQAGATALAATMNKVTTGSANDGVALPAGTTPMCVWVTNISANALKVYGANADDDTIDGGSADASVTQAASAKAIWYCTSNGVAWTSGN